MDEKRVNRPLANRPGRKDCSAETPARLKQSPILIARKKPVQAIWPTAVQLTKVPLKQALRAGGGRE